MKREAADILKDALALPTEARAALAGSLLDSLDTEVDEDAEAAWATEVNRGVAELDSGAVKTVPSAAVRRRRDRSCRRVDCRATRSCASLLRQYQTLLLSRFPSSLSTGYDARMFERFTVRATRILFHARAQAS